VSKKTLANLSSSDLSGKHIGAGDFNVPLDDQGNITDDTRIALPFPQSRI